MAEIDAKTRAVVPSVYRLAMTTGVPRGGGFGGFNPPPEIPKF
jgi:hypothetical protein